MATPVDPVASAASRSQTAVADDECPGCGLSVLVCDAYNDHEGGCIVESQAVVVVYLPATDQEKFEWAFQQIENHTAGWSGQRRVYCSRDEAVVEYVMRHFRDAMTGQS